MLTTLVFFCKKAGRSGGLRSIAFACSGLKLHACRANRAPDARHAAGFVAEMLVCSCNYITEAEIRDVIVRLLDEDCWQLIVPVKVYHAMEKRGRCCGCFPNVVELIIKTSEEYHRLRDSTQADVVVYMSRLREFHEANRRADIERRRKNHRAA